MPPGTVKRSLDGTIDAFLDYLVVERGLLPNTIYAYARDLRSYLETLEEIGVADPARITDEAIELFAVRLSRRGLAPASRARTLSTLRHYHRFQAREGWGGERVARACPSFVTRHHTIGG
jgi:integrase/recombinase XerD